MGPALAGWWLPAWGSACRGGTPRSATTQRSPRIVAWDSWFPEPASSQLLLVPPPPPQRMPSTAQHLRPKAKRRRHFAAPAPRLPPRPVLNHTPRPRRGSVVLAHALDYRQGVAGRECERPRCDAAEGTRKAEEGGTAGRRLDLVVLLLQPSRDEGGTFPGTDKEGASMRKRNKRLTDRRTDRLTDRPIDRPTNRPTDRPTDRPTPLTRASSA